MSKNVLSGTDNGHASSNKTNADACIISNLGQVHIVGDMRTGTITTNKIHEKATINFKNMDLKQKIFIPLTDKMSNINITTTKAVTMPMPKTMTMPIPVPTPVTVPVTVPVPMTSNKTDIKKGSTNSSDNNQQHIIKINNTAAAVAATISVSVSYTEGTTKVVAASTLGSNNSHNNNNNNNNNNCSNQKGLMHRRELSSINGQNTQNMQPHQQQQQCLRDPSKYRYVQPQTVPLQINKNLNSGNDTSRDVVDSFRSSNNRSSINSFNCGNNINYISCTTIQTESESLRPNKDDPLTLVYYKGNLISGSLEALIQHIVPTYDYYPEPFYIFAFVLSARLFIRPYELLAKISQIWEMQQQMQTQAQTQKQTKLQYGSGAVVSVDQIDDCGQQMHNYMVAQESKLKTKSKPITITSVTNSPMLQHKLVSYQTQQQQQQQQQQQEHQQQQQQSLYHTQKSAQNCIRLLTEWMETFPYDFRDERLMQQVRILTRKCVYIDNTLGKQVSRMLQLLVQRLTALEQYEEFLQALMQNDFYTHSNTVNQQHQTAYNTSTAASISYNNTVNTAVPSTHSSSFNKMALNSLNSHHYQQQPPQQQQQQQQQHKQQPQQLFGHCSHYNKQACNLCNVNLCLNAATTVATATAAATSAAAAAVNLPTSLNLNCSNLVTSGSGSSYGSTNVASDNAGAGNHEVFGIMDLCNSCAQLAHQLTAIELERLSHIGPEEFVQAFAKEYQTNKSTNATSTNNATVGLHESATTSSSSSSSSASLASSASSSSCTTSLNDMKKTRNLECYVDWFNRLSYLTATEIVKYTKKKQRVRVIEYWIETARECFNIGNFNSLMAIIAGLNLSPISRLKKTWSKVQSAKFSVLEHQMDPTSNFNSYRSTLKAAMWRSEGATEARERIIIPFFSLFVKDLYFLNEGCSNRLPNNHINFEKCSQLAKQVMEFNEWKKVICPFEKSSHIIAYLQNTSILNETTLAMASFECEPPENTEEKDRYKTVKAENKQQLLQQLQDQQQQQQYYYNNHYHNHQLQQQQQQQPHQH